ncbi:dicarboxylate--CoA ligase PimA [Acidisphaera sp. L21]|uniref:dicarboxylate--CoA ligase PimA n=1 Tax=Acidisphaera sp. L21 TaxID=1641851 RepID=UPI00131B4793|nr:dicarboxylate--CoA ligase PimA [Acidisphaera sp. L21]
MGTRPFAWERSYPPALRWDADLDVTTLPVLLDRAVASFGDRPFIEFRGRQIGFRAFGDLVDRAAAGLRRLGVGPGVSVALYLPNVPYHPISFFGVLRAGGRVVHLSPLDPPRALARKLADSGARILVTTDDKTLLPQALSLLADEPLDHLIVGEDAAWGAGPPTLALPPDARILSFAQLSEAEFTGPWPQQDPAEVAVLQYTGGTTGLPRAAMLTHANLTAATSIYEHWYAGTGRTWQQHDRVIGVLPLFHIYMLTTVLLRCLKGGVEILLRQRFEPAQILDDIEKGRATTFPGVPTMFIAMAAQPGIDRRDLTSLRTASCGGAPLPVEVAQRFETLTGRRVGGGWGMTETSPAGTVILPDMPMRPGLIGLPLPQIEMDVADLTDPHRVLAPGETGEIRIRGPNVTAGYWNRPEENDTAFADGFFLTGDVGRMDAGGNFYIVDRKKDMIISGGFNVYPRQIEDAVYEHAAVEECTVVGIPDAYRGQSAKAFVKLRDGAEPFSLEELRAFLADRLGRHELPTAVEFRDALPRTAVGKLSRKELAEEEKIRASETEKA